MDKKRLSTKADRFGDHSAEGKQYANLPVDKGWAWIIALAVFLLYAIYGGIHVTNSVLLLDMLDYFHTPVSTMTIQLALNQVCYGLASQVSANILAVRFSIRKMATLAALVNVLGTLFLVAVPCPPVFIVAMCIKTTFHGITIVPSVSLIGYYFEKKRAFAMAFCILGLSFGATVVPVLIDYLRNEYGFRGCLLLYGAVEMQAIPISLLLRPLSSYQGENKVKDDFKRNPGDEENGTTPNTDRSDLGYKPTKITSEVKDDPLVNELDVLLINNCDSALHDSQLTDLELDLNKTNFNGSHLGSEGEKTPMFSMPTEHTESEKKSKILSKEADSVYIPTDVNTSTRNIPEIPEPRSVSKGQNSVKRLNGNQIIAFFTSLIDFQLLKKPLAISSLLSYNLFNELIFLNTYFPSFGEEMGASPSQAALLLTVSGAVDVFSKLLLGFITDLKVMAPYKIIIIGSICIGVVCQLNGFFNSLGPLLFFAVCLGFFGGTGVSLNSVHMIQVLGVNSLSKMLALCILTFSVTAVVQNVLIGVLIERTGSFSVPLYLCGINYLLASLVLSLIPLTRRLQISMERKKLKS